MSPEKSEARVLRSSQISNLFNQWRELEGHRTLDRGTPATVSYSIPNTSLAVAMVAVLRSKLVAKSSLFHSIGCKIS